MFAPLLLLLLLYFGPHLIVAASLFRWLPSDDLLRGDNWTPSGAAPCADDVVRLDSGDEDADASIALAQLNGPLKVQKVVLPTNGILYFGGRESELATAKSAADWQCARRAAGPKDAIFNAHAKKPNFFDAQNWRIEPHAGKRTHARVLLDAERVPAEEDDVLVPASTVSKMFIDVPIKIRSMNISDQRLSTIQLHRMLSTVEGQFSVQFGARFDTIHIDAADGSVTVKRVPTVFTVSDPDATVGDGNERQQRARFFGRANANIFEPQFSALCTFVHCVPVEPYCTDPVQPAGHCCPVCGSILRFRQSSLNFSLSQAIVDEHVKLKVQDRNVGVSFVRIDKDDFQALYQLSVLPAHPAHYVESLYCSIMWSVFRKVQQRGINAHLPVEYQPSGGADFFDLRTQCSVQKGILHWATVFRAVLLIAMLALVIGVLFAVQYRRSVRFRLFVARVRNVQQPHVRVSWQRARGRVEMFGAEAQQRWFNAEFMNRAFGAKTDNEEQGGHRITDFPRGHSVRTRGVFGRKMGSDTPEPEAASDAF